jgi:4-hydroxy-tetrahydrodipicolinate synthase
MSSRPSDVGAAKAAGLHAGVFSVVATPFHDDERVDHDSLRRLVSWLVEAGVDGLLVLGVLGEADRLTDAERDAVLETVLARVAGRVPVVVGVSHNATRVAAARARHAELFGAAAVLVSPPILGPGSPEHFLEVAAAVSIPVVVQDHPASSGVELSVELLAGLGGLAIKVEAPPTPPKIAALLELEPRSAAFGGLGATALLDELDAGAAGTMTGFAFPERLVAIVRAYRRGNRTLARELFEAALPLIVFEAQPGFGAAIRKEILRRRGVIASARTRAPARELDPYTEAALDVLLTRYAPENPPPEDPRSVARTT